MSYDDEWAYVVSRIKFYREAKGWSIQELGYNADIDRSSLSKIESSVADMQNGSTKRYIKSDIYFSTLVKIADALGVKISDLVR